MGLLFTISVIFLLVPSFSLLYAFQLPDNDTFSKWNRILEMKLSDLVEAVTQIDFARTVYKSDPGVVTLQKVNGEEVLNSVLKNVGALLHGKKLALRKLTDRAEEEFSKFQKKTNKSMLTLEDISFFNVKALKSSAKMRFNPRFGQKVCFEESGVHIPLKIFDGWMGPRYKEAWWHDPEILNGLNWTAGLDEIFKENRKNDPNLRWQYFGSFYGFMRVYPAFRWPDHPGLPDLFDVRRRSWYIQGSVSPKDVIILIDRSGSVHGPTLDIIKITARALLNSLGENDYVNVAWFNDKVKWVVPCLDTLVQATSQIRRLLGDAVERLTESNLTDYSAALDFAFEAFRKFDETKKPWAGSECHKIIMFLSDGGTEWPTDPLAKHCNESRNGRIKIFAFACGPHPIPTVVLKEMACATGGYFSPVTALGSVRVKIQDYAKVLSRPLARSEDREAYRWHNFYRDVGGLGTVTTVSLPVFDGTAKKGNSDRLLGVMGIDVPVEEMLNLFPKRLLGPFGYAFAVNTNGFVLFHPRLHDHIVYIEDPQNIYLTDLEGTSEEIERMEKAMIDGTRGSLKNFRSIVPVGSGRASLVDLDYFYEAVEPAPFRFGIAVPSKRTIAKIRIPDVKAALSVLSTAKGILVAPWNYCPAADDDAAFGQREDLPVEELAVRILDNYASCDENLVNHLLWDVEKMDKIKARWTETDSTRVRSRFLISSGGSTLVHSSDIAEEYQRQVDPLKNNLYKRAAATPGFALSVAEGRRREVTVAGRITLDDSFVTGVIGAEIEQESIREIFEEATGGGTGDGGCDSPERLHCYLLNDGGIITAGNVEKSKAGDFLGIHDPELLEFLLSVEILKREYRYNYQSWCSKDENRMQTMAAPRHFSILGAVRDAFVSFRFDFIYATLLYFISSVLAWKKVENADSFLDFGNHSCVTRSAWYYHAGVSDASAVLNCESGSRYVRASFLPNVTLIFLIAQPPCNDSRRYPALSLEPEEDVEPDHCSGKQHYRLRPDKCYSQVPKVAHPRKSIRKC